MSEMITPRKRFASTTVDGKLYVFGGSDGHRRLSTAEMFDPETNSWTELKNMRQPRNGCSCAAIGHNIYVIGGMIGNGERSTTGEIFNTIKKTWSKLPGEMSVPRDQHASVAVGDKIFVMGGYRCGKNVEAYDTKKKKWSNMSSMKELRYGFGALVANDKIYAIGGKTEFKGENTGREYHRHLNTMEVYDPTNDEWTLAKEKMRNRRYGNSVVQAASKIIVLGGCDEENFVKAVEAYDLKEERWSGSIIHPFSEERQEFGAALLGIDLFIFGGSTTSRSRSCHASVEQYKDALTLVAVSDPMNVPIPDDNKTTNVDPNISPIMDKGLVKKRTKTRRVVNKTKVEMRSRPKRKRPAIPEPPQKKRHSSKKTKSKQAEEAKKKRKNTTTGTKEKKKNDKSTQERKNSTSHAANIQKNEPSRNNQTQDSQRSQSMIGSQLASIQKLLNKKKEETERYEMEIFGNAQKGPLKKRVEAMIELLE